MSILCYSISFKNVAVLWCCYPHISANIINNRTSRFRSHAATPYCEITASTLSTATVANGWTASIYWWCANQSYEKPNNKTKFASMYFNTCTKYGWFVDTCIKPSETNQWLSPLVEPFKHDWSKFRCSFFNESTTLNFTGWMVSSWLDHAGSTSRRQQAVGLNPEAATASDCCAKNLEVAQRAGHQHK